MLVLDYGPCVDAAIILCEASTLRDHVTLEDHGRTITVTHNDGIPFELWGSGTQALWLLLSAIAYSSETVSLCGVASRLDQRNSRVAGSALTRLFGVGHPVSAWCECDLWSTACVYDDQGACLTHPTCPWCMEVAS